MNRIFFIIITGTVLVGLYSCSKNKSDDSPKSVVQILLDHHEKDMVVANNAFGFDIFKTIIAAEPSDSNIFISPLSISIALAMTYNGANGDTRTEIQNTLRFPDLSSDEINSYFLKITSALLQIDPKVNLGIANSMWYVQGLPVLHSFIQVNQDFYNAQVRSLDFSNPASVDTINKWANDKTNKKIPQVIDLSDLQNDVMFLINAIYFKGDWTSEFDKDATRDTDFILSSNSTVTASLMRQKGSYNYFSNEQFSAVEMPYGQGNFTMLVLLPNQGYTTSDIITNLSSENWDGWLNNLSKQFVDITFPRFKIAWERTLNDDLIKLGMPLAFTGAADFSKIVQEGGLMIDFVKHKSFVEVNEAGTEAAAVTVVSFGKTSGPEYKLFTVNKPFIFAIRETTTNAILFIGRVSNPV